MRSPAKTGRSGDVLAVVSQSGSTVSFFDAESDRGVGVVEVPPEPHELLFDPTHRVLWCTHTYRSGYYHANAGRRSEITAIDPDGKQIIDVVDLAPEHAPHGLALDADRGRLYVSVEGAPGRSGGVVVVDTGSRKPLGRIDTGAPGPHWFAIGPDGTTGYATNKEAPFVSVVDLVAGELVGRVEVPGSEGLAVSADGARVYVGGPYVSFTEDGSANANGVRVIDAETRTVAEVLPTENRVMPVHLTAGGKLLVGELRPRPAAAAGVTGQDPGRLVVFAADGHERLGELEIGRSPLTITSSPDGALGYASCVVDSAVDVVDLDSLRVLTRIRVAKAGDAGAHGLAYVPCAG
ncbi:MULTISPECIES: YncE family protein [unclassified Saccharopolyspora]|uniref:YncE family protein n=1 Tax=unclassified Saccharopolyspora TaxID=2646250 RepID=UPI001CD1E4AE|nr:MULTISPECIES: YncE family protein [unclassified Saccharopolyspora]MCA1227197.1 YncE family protein [Saccharopolyspora sp. 6M]MCA1281896.1 YncE family protein [Saccharopolyspora sp. 7B]